MQPSFIALATAAGVALATLAAPAPLTAQSTVQAIRFPPGGTGVTLTGYVGRGERRYTLVARGGQRMRVRLRSDTGDVVADIVAPNGRVIPGGASDDSGRAVTRLPYSGRYSVVVYREARGRPAQFSLSISII